MKSLPKNWIWVTKSHVYTSHEAVHVADIEFQQLIVLSSVHYFPSGEFNRYPPWTNRKVSNIRRTRCQNLNASRLGLQLSLRNLLKQVLSGEWRCSWSSADRRCSNHILVINNLIAY